NVSSAGSTICTVWPWAPVAESCARVARTCVIGLQKSDTTTISASEDGANSGGRLGRSATSCTIAFAILSSTLRLPVGRITPAIATRSPPRLHQYFGEGEGDDQASMELGFLGELGAKHHGRRAVGPQPHRVRGLPFLLAHVEMLVAGGAPPVDAARRLARQEAAVLPEIFARPRPPAALPSVDDGGGDSARLARPARHALPGPAGLA